MSRSGGDVCQLKKRKWDQETVWEFLWHPQGELNRRLCRYHLNGPKKAKGGGLRMSLWLPFRNPVQPQFPARF